MSSSPTILVIDDDPGIVSWLVESLPEEGFHARGEVSATRALSLIKEEAFDLVISDVEMPEMRGPDLLRAIQKIRPRQMVLLITAFGSIDLAVESVRAGAVDFIAKPFRIEVLELAMRRALRERQMRHEIGRLREAATRDLPSGMAAKSPAMRRARDLASRVAKSQLPVMITGESGVGKGLLARFVHEKSECRNAKYVHLNCAALPAGIAEAELFGVRKGAFTDAREDRIGLFEQANGGTLFLDEIGELALETQPKLLQALESNHVRPLGGTSNVAANVRIITATNRPLEDAIRERRFRPDLYHRLNVIRIAIPPLRERVDDIEPIVDQVLQNIAKRTGSGSWSVSPDAIRWLRSHTWPGNVRELVNATERAVALSEREVLTAEDFRPEAVIDSDDAFLHGAVQAELSLLDIEREYIRRVLAKTGGHKARAARILGLDRRTLYRKVAELSGTPLSPTEHPPETENE